MAPKDRLSSNGFNTDGSLMNVGNKIWDPAQGGRPSIRLYPEYSSGTAMASLLSGDAADAESYAGRRSRSVRRMDPNMCSTERDDAPPTLEETVKDWLASPPTPARSAAPDRSKSSTNLRPCSPAQRPRTSSAAPRPSSATRRPSSVTCSLCGGEFGTASINIHAAQCQKRHEAAAACPAKSPQKPRAPKAVPAVLLPQTETCPHCQRNFGPNSIKIHMARCKMKCEAVPSPAKSPTPKRPASARPATPLRDRPSSARPATSLRQRTNQYATKVCSARPPQSPPKPHGSPAKPLASPSRQLHTPLRNRGFSQIGMQTIAAESLGMKMRERARSSSSAPRLAALTQQHEDAAGQCTLQKSQPSSPSGPGTPSFGLSCASFGFEDTPKEDMEYCKVILQSTLPHLATFSENHISPEPASEQMDGRSHPDWNLNDLMPCPHCRRTFLPDRLQVHLRSCRSKSPAGPRAKGVQDMQECGRLTPNLQQNAWQSSGRLPLV